MNGLPLTSEENAAAKANWARMPEDMRAFVVALEAAGMIDGRRALAVARVAIAPEALPSDDGVQPCLPSREERAAIQAIKSRGKRV